MNIIEVTVQLHAESEKAVRVSDDGESENAVQIPRSQIEAQQDLGNGVIELSLPERLALDKGLIQLTHRLY